MLSYFYPDLYVDDIYSIPYNTLLGQGKNALIFDIDNTIVPHFVKQPDEKHIALFASLKEMGFSICILSNGRKKRVIEFMKGLAYHYIYRARKPFLSGLTEALRACGATSGSAVIIGDQIFTDILAGKRGKVYTVLVKPVSKKDELWVMFKRPAERLIINEYEKEKRRGHPN